MFHGSMVALVTPMEIDTGNIDFISLDKLIEWHIEQGTQGIVVAGTTGESALLGEQEKAELIGHTVNQVKRRIPVIAGTGSTSTQATITQTQAAMELGVDACLLMTPPYIKPTQKGLYEHFKAVAEAVAIPQILYNVPGRTACDILPDTVVALAHIPNIVGIKEATGDVERAKTLHQQTGSSLDLFSGDDATAAPFILQGGGKGVISVTANVMPQKMSALCAAAQAQESAKVAALEEVLAPLHDALFLEANPIPVKWALSYLGLIPAGIRLPLTPLSQCHQEHLKQILHNLGLHHDKNHQ
ncbi:MAG: 4-hydroxy-tetrahydrodipicolinate synthase [Gammaproteobacteria bacterium]